MHWGDEGGWDSVPSRSSPSSCGSGKSHLSCAHAGDVGETDPPRSGASGEGSRPAHLIFNVATLSVTWGRAGVRRDTGRPTLPCLPKLCYFQESSRSRRCRAVTKACPELDKRRKGVTACLYLSLRRGPPASLGLHSKLTGTVAVSTFICPTRKE